ncbi:hypothetical protein ACFFK0_24120 [Paenibacillus chartarius]|uniref:Extracellular solute-binding protein n=1 Tax=Paenibacillus chartarius TaxID=747481 RepID=A0ABV6DS62_9BACL
MRKAQWIGALVLLAIIAVSAVIKLQMDRSAPAAGGGAAAPNAPVTLKGIVGSEKEAFFGDKEVLDIARTRYGFALDIRKAGSLEMTEEAALKANDFVFPASETVVEQIKSSVQVTGTEEVFRTPLVYYSWDAVTRLLKERNIVRDAGADVLELDTAKLVELIAADKKWEDIGLKVFGPIAVDTSDPAKSNSGNAYAALVAASLNGGNLVTADRVDGLMPSLRNMFAKTGFKKSSTTDLFEEYVKTGMGSHKIIVGYESDVLYFSKQNPDVWQSLQSSVAPQIVYPAPTMWSVHTLVTLNEKSKGMTAFLQDPDVQRIAWERYGFRTGLIGVTNDPAAFRVKGIARSIDNVMQTPDYATMQKLLEAYRAK